MKVTKAIPGFSCNPGSSRLGPYVFDLPAGLRVKRITEGATAGCYFLDEFPKSIFGDNPILLHDATYYGIVLAPGQVEDK